MPLLICTVALSVVDNVATQLLATAAQVGLGSACCYAAARILRPPTTSSAERTLRHSFAAVATTMACYVAAVVVVTRLTRWFETEGTVVPLWWFWPLIPGLTLFTVAWGLIAVLVRLVRDRG